MLQTITAKWRESWDFVSEKIWFLQKGELSPTQFRWVSLLKLLLLAYQGFDKNKCTLRASALTFYTMLSIVPVLAMAFGISQGFGLETYLQEVLIEKFKGQEQVFEWVFGFAHAMLQETQGGLVAGIGFFALAYSVLKLLNNIEEAFTTIWELDRSRPWIRKFTDYTTIVLLTPIVLVLSSGINVFIHTGVELVMEKLAFLGFFAPIIRVLLELVPILLMGLLLSLYYIVMPYTLVKPQSGIIAGLLAGAGYHLVQWVYITFQVGASQASAVYGSFAALPLFLAWLQLTWMLILLGAEFAFAHQHFQRLSFGQVVKNMHQEARLAISLAIVRLVGKRFLQADTPLGKTEIAQLLNLPAPAVEACLSDLVATGLLNRIRHTEEKKQEDYFQPSSDPRRFTFALVAEKLNTLGDAPDYGQASEALSVVQEKLNEYRQFMHQHPVSQPIIDWK